MACKFLYLLTGNRTEHADGAIGRSRNHARPIGGKVNRLDPVLVSLDHHVAGVGEIRQILPFPSAKTLRSVGEAALGGDDFILFERRRSGRQVDDVRLLLRASFGGNRGVSLSI